MGEVPKDDRAHSSPFAFMYITTLNDPGAHIFYVVWSVPKDLMEHISIRLDLSLSNQLSHF